ncbi:group I intron-associated PD-(D/E)XK endonuclease [Neobacillus sp. DY30]|uniref:group I intron-associated PD-(D/E)XK endonuclease n=1 Tax=Neobacillus sp. DY30 TaxID=3047871 RepID=UPI0024BFB355|nr:group I intron-associated PD-(D/E)XK endonuclease [Neobacillus sp. DY30]WHY01828.1 group I intron-associated PD-(D/E)XK endonuclease [Neobacillus sp. DY30]
MAHETTVKGRHSELLAQSALLANGWNVSEPIAPEAFDLVARAPGSSVWQRIQIKSARVREDRDGSIVCYARKNNGETYNESDCDLFIAVLNGDVYLFQNRNISEYWVTPDNIADKWTKLEIGIETLKEASA